VSDVMFVTFRLTVRRYEFLLCNGYVLLKFRELTDKTHAPISQMVFNIYKYAIFPIETNYHTVVFVYFMKGLFLFLRKKYEEPSKEEGFSQIVKINFLPEFRSIEDERLYKMFLLED